MSAKGSIMETSGMKEEHNSHKDNKDTEQPVMDEDWHRTSRSVVRKLDMTLMPMIWLLYLFNYLDRNNIA